jgi:hypothetical protein
MWNPYCARPAGISHERSAQALRQEIWELKRMANEMDAGPNQEAGDAFIEIEALSEAELEVRRI